ncbi:CDP-alcohol phosphatidyltransferase family protein [Candidatus Saccharibacteria bacterium]|nr:CDP-alcohol phosphatidyltransferase family protein [Candidatus Saccharibacteria bacterium]
MRYLADILTFSRMGLSVALLVMIFTDAPIHAAFIVYMIGEITDALDGTCATHFPFPKNKIPRYRKYAAKYDMLADGMLAFAVVLFFTIRVSLITGIILFATYPLISTILEFIVYGKFLGHPDDCTKTSLMHRNFKLAKTIVLARRNVYLAIMFMIAVWMLYASEWSLLTKNIIMGIGIAGSLFFWIFLSTRRHNISRDAIDIEKELSKPKK